MEQVIYDNRHCDFFFFHAKKKKGNTPSECKIQCQKMKRKKFNGKMKC